MKIVNKWYQTNNYKVLIECSYQQAWCYSAFISIVGAADLLATLSTKQRELLKEHTSSTVNFSDKHPLQGFQIYIQIIILLICAGL